MGELFVQKNDVLTVFGRKSGADFGYPRKPKSWKSVRVLSVSIILFPKNVLNIGTNAVSRYQTRLQQNLILLASLADSQPNHPPSQTSTSSTNLNGNAQATLFQRDAPVQVSLPDDRAVVLNSFSSCLFANLQNNHLLEYCFRQDQVVII
jgi:hypothetical protein